MDVMEKSIVQSNPLIEARKEMTLAEMRLFCIGLLDLMPVLRDDIDKGLPDNEEDYPDFPKTLIPPSDLEKLMRNRGSVAHLRRSIKKAFAGSIEIRDGKGSFWLRHIYEEMYYEKEEGLYIQFHRKMRPYLIDLIKGQFTSIKAKEIFSLSSEYAWRLMELLQEKRGFLKDHDKAFIPPMTVEELKFALNVPADAYKGRMNNFRKKVLDEPIKEIVESTPYKVWYEVQKVGRRVSGFQIWIALKTNKEQAAVDEEKQEREIKKALENETIQAMVRVGVLATTAKILYEQYGEERCSVNLNFAKQNKERKDNFPGFVVKAIQDDYAKGYPIAELTEEEKAEKKEKEKQESAERVKRGFEIEYEGYEVTNPIFINKKKEIQNRIEKIADDKKL